MVLKTLTLAFESRQPVRIIYDSGKALTERTVDVLAIDGDRIVAYCHLRKNRRAFALGKILSARIQSGFEEL
ncbi:MAG: WYL domain-containing protein [Bacillota bacterium]